jgi:hypothetical protein
MVDEPQLANSNVLVGGKVLIKLAGQTVGFAQSARCTDSYRYQPVHVLGQLQAIEYIPMTATHEITMESMVMRNDSLTRHNLEPWGAGSYGFLADGTNIGQITGRPNSFNAIGGGSATAGKLLESGRQEKGGALSVIDGKTFTISIMDAASKKNIVEYRKCYYAAGGFTISANNIVGHQVTFYAVYKVGQMDAGGDSGLTQNYQTAQAVS